jgi:hypothetical protein
MLKAGHFKEARLDAEERKRLYEPKLLSVEPAQRKSHPQGIDQAP